MHRTTLKQDIKDAPARPRETLEPEKGPPSKTVGHVKGKLRYEVDKQDSLVGASCKEARRYFVGDVMIARVHIWVKGGHPSNQPYVCSRSASQGNGDIGFETEQELHEYLMGLLQ